MKLPLVLCATLALALTTPAKAQQIDLSTITCKDFFEGNKERIEFVIVWLMGFYTEEDDPPILDFGKMKQKAASSAPIVPKTPPTA